MVSYIQCTFGKQLSKVKVNYTYCIFTCMKILCPFFLITEIRGCFLFLFD